MVLFCLFSYKFVIRCIKTIHEHKEETNYKFLQLIKRVESELPAHLRTRVPEVLEVAAGAGASVVVVGPVGGLADVGHGVRGVVDLVVTWDPRVPALLLAEHDLVHVRLQVPVTDLGVAGRGSVPGQLSREAFEIRFANPKVSPPRFQLYWMA